MKVFHVLIGCSVALPVIAFIYSQLFIFDLGKVQVDVTVASYQFLLTLYVLFIAVSICGRDIGQRVCYLFITPPVNRTSFLSGRFLGLILGMGLLTVSLMLTTELLLWFTINNEQEAYRHGINHGTGLSVAVLSYYQHISLLAIAVMVCTMATGLAEMMVFVSGFIIISWTLPPILGALQSQDTLKETPDFIEALLHALSSFFPSQNSGDLYLAIAHGVELGISDYLLNFAEHLGYSMIAYGIALFFFNRRDL